MNQIVKEKKRIPTPKQRKAAKAIVENLLSDKPVPTGQVLENVGYGLIAQDPNRITESEGFKIALAETGLREALIAEGIDGKKIAEKVKVLLEAKTNEKDDYNAIDKGLKHATAIYGIIQDKPPESKTTYNFIFDANVQNEVKHMESRIKSLLTGNVQEIKENVATEQQEPRSSENA